jgi:hypothetical protein
VGLERGPLSFVSTIEELLERKVAAPVWKSQITTVVIRRADHVTPPQSTKVATNFADKLWPLDQYSSLAD